MPATITEITTLHNRLVCKHGPDATSIASMLLYVWKCIDGPARDANMSILMPCVHARMRELNITPRQIETVIKDLEKTHATLAYLSSLTDD